jgi:4-coumarate--CoA ligase
LDKNVEQNTRLNPFKFALRIPGEFHHAFNLSKPKIIFTSLYAVDKVVDVAQFNFSFVQQVVLYGNENPVTSRVTLYTDYLTTVPEATKYDSFYCEPLDVVQHVALVLCSSGTTGLPKGVQLTQYNLMVCAAHTL